MRGSVGVVGIDLAQPHALNSDSLFVPFVRASASRAQIADRIARVNAAEVGAAFLRRIGTTTRYVQIAGNTGGINGTSGSATAGADMRVGSRVYVTLAARGEVSRDFTSHGGGVGFRFVL